MNPTLRIKTISTLKAGMASLSPQMRIAAKYVIDHQLDFGLDAIRTTANKAGISTYTFVKLAKLLGFDSYDAFRSPFRHALVSGGTPLSETDWQAVTNDGSPAGQAFSAATRNALAIVANSLHRQRLEDLHAVVETLVSARRVYVTGVRSSYCVAYYLHYVGRMAIPSMELIPRHQNSAIDDLNDAGEGDVLVACTITPYSRETIEACIFAKKRGVVLVLLTDSEVILPEMSADHTLVAAVLSSHNFSCLSGMMAMVELLVALLMQHDGEAALERISSYEKLRVEHNAYWEPKEKR